MQTQAQQSNTHFSHSIETNASADKIWQIWTDVPNWKQWDKGLKTAELKGDFQLHTKGVLIPDKGAKAKFVIVEFVDNQSYTFKTNIPFGALYVKRFLSKKGEKTVFTHEVWFTGISKGLFGRLLGKNYRKILPDVMSEIEKIAMQ
jgi:hypothetical protein